MLCVLHRPLIRSIVLLYFTRNRLHTFQQPMSLREGMYDLLLRGASSVKFPGAGLGQEGGMSLAELQDRGAWLFTLNAAVRLLAECASGSGIGLRPQGQAVGDPGAGTPLTRGMATYRTLCDPRPCVPHVIAGKARSQRS